MEQARKARARKQGAAWENAVLEAETPHNKVKAVGEPAREPEEVPAVAKAREQAGAPVEVAAKVAEKAAAIGSNKSTIQEINDI
jgi:hypothetical protein